MNVELGGDNRSSKSPPPRGAVLQEEVPAQMWHQGRDDEEGWIVSKVRGHREQERETLGKKLTEAQMDWEFSRPCNSPM